MDFKEFKLKFEIIPVTEYPNEIQTNPIVSVCVQTYNHEDYIKPCLDSILEQKTTFKFEIIISEDESCDKTRDICIQYAIKHPTKIKLYLNSRNNNIKVDGEPTGNFTTLYNMYSANGKYIAICEGDDFWNDPFKLQKQYEFMEAQSNYSICYHDFNIVNRDNHIINSDKANPLRKDLKKDELLIPFTHPASLTIFFRNYFKIYPRHITEILTFDVFLYTLLGEKGAGKYLSQIDPSSYRVHDKGIWSERNLEEKLKTKINTYNKISQYYITQGKKDTSIKFQKRIFKLYGYLLYLSFKKIQVGKFIKYLLILIKFEFRIF